MSLPRPKYVIALERIGKSNLDAGCKNVLRVMLEWINLETGLLWPGAGNMTKRLGWDPEGRSVRRVIAKLIQEGVVIVTARGGGVDRFGRGRATEYRVDFGALKPAPNTPATRTNGQGSTNGVTRPVRRQSRTAVSANPDPLSAQPSSQEPPREHSNGESAEASQRRAVLDGWSIGSAGERAIQAGDLRGLLMAMGVWEYMATPLAACDQITIERVDQVAAGVMADPEAVNKPLCLGHRLATAFGITLPPSPATSQLMAQGRASGLEGIARLRFQRKRRDPRRTDNQEDSA